VANLDHPNIVRAFEVGCLGPVHYLVMEFVDGPNFQALVEESGPLLPGDAAVCALQAAQALQHLYQAGLVHRDIKPSNLLLASSGDVKLLDLGLARFCQDQGDRLTSLQGAGVMGSVDYLSPEQARDSHTVDIRTDIYGLGATLYFLLVGRVLFPGATIEQKLLWTQVRDPEDVRKLRPEIPERLAVVLRRMLAKDPDDRYQTPQGVVEALSSWETAPEPSPSEQDTRTSDPASEPERANEQGIAPERQEVRPGPAPERASGMRWWHFALALLGVLVLGAGVVYVWLHSTGRL
jgi:serine/threonine protein kinase